MKFKNKILDWINRYRLGSKNRIAGYFTKIFILCLDLTFALISFAFAVFVDRTLNATSWSLVMFSYLPLILLTLRAISFVFFKTYLIIIRFVGERDFINLFLATTSSTLAFFAILKFFPLVLPGDRAATVVVIDYLFLLYLSGGFRVLLRILYKYLRSQKNGPLANTIIYGAGQLGAQTQNILEASTNAHFKVIAFLDDNPKVNRKQLNGTPIYNVEDNLEEVIEKLNIEQAIIAIRDLPDHRRIHFINTCLEQKVEVLKVPSTSEWVNNKLSEKQLRKVKLTDLLNRPTIELDKMKISSEINGLCVLVTGCAGSIGSEMVRQLLKFNPQMVLGVDQAETPLVELQRELKDDRFVAIVGDVRAANKMKEVFLKYRPEYVFHSAAYKHVPIMERHPEEAVQTNLLGSINIARAAVMVGSKKFVLVSTDKVVNPTSVMGASKNAAEVFIRHMQDSKETDTQFIITRFGNVLGSSGSVIPLFQNQIKKRQALTVTHKDITRFFMTIPEACQLVLEAGVMGNGGEIFVFDMGEPIRIYDLARRLIQLSGLVPGKDIPIHIVGLRPGEKLYEELLTSREKMKPTHHPKIMIAKIEDKVKPEDLECFQELTNLCRGRGNLDEILANLKKLVPEYARPRHAEVPLRTVNTMEKKESDTQKSSQNDLNKRLGKLKGEKGLKRMFLRTVGMVLPTDIFAPRHAIAVKAICVIQDQVVLLKTETGRWDLPGGKLKPGERWQDCIKREVREELNLEVRNCQLLKLEGHRLRQTAQVTIVLVTCEVEEDPNMISLSQEHFGVQLATAEKLQSIPLLLPYDRTINEVLQKTAVN